MQNRIYWGSDAPKTWKRATPKAQSIPSVPLDYSPQEKASSGKTHRFVISTSAVDRSGDTIDQNGWDLKAYRKNPIVLAFHDANQWPVGRANKISVEGGRLVAEVQFADTHQGRTAKSLVESGMLRATSVGFVPTEAKASSEKGRLGGYDFKKQELMEFSLVPVPANPECLICMSAKEEREHQAQQYREQAKADLAAATEAKRLEAYEARMARTTPAQRKREREAALLRIKGSA
jgi:HK97 family phage prohead protease